MYSPDSDGEYPEDPEGIEIVPRLREFMDYVLSIGALPSTINLQIQRPWLLRPTSTW